MAELNEKLSEILSSPEMMDKVMNVVKALSDSSGSPATEQQTVDLPAKNEEPAQDDPPVTASILSKLDPRLISSAMSILGEYSKDDDGIRLMRALKPHLDKEHSERVDRAIDALRLSRSVRSVLSTIKGGGKDVFKV